RGAERNIRRLAFKYILIDDKLYRRTAEDLLLKCLDSDQARIAMGEVHEGICGTHQSAPKMKWLLRRSGFYWPSMMSDCFKYYKGCEDVTPQPTDSTREVEHFSDATEELCSSSLFPDLSNTYLELSVVMHVQCCLNKIEP